MFLGIALPDGVRRALRSELRNVAIPGRAVLPEKWHLTLVYVGSISVDPVERLVRELRREDLGSQAVITFTGMGAFPRPSRASVLWLGLGDGAEEVATLQSHVRQAVGRVGLSVEDRPFVPHLTLSRIRPAIDVRDLIETARAIDVRMPVQAVVLFRSIPGGGQAAYEELARFQLGTAG